MPHATPRTRVALPRARRRIPVAFEAGRLRGAGRIAKLGKHGFFVCTEALPKPGHPVRVVIHDPQRRRNIEISGSVRWNTEQIDPTRSGFGVEIDAQSHDYCEFYERVLLS
jgi:hypothetical protein